MKIELRKNSWHSNLYLWTYDANILPKSLCNYFWALLFAIVSIPLTIWSLPQTWLGVKPDNYLIRLAQSLLTLFLLGIFTLFVIAFIEKPAEMFASLGIFIGVAVGIILVIFAYFGIKETGVIIKDTDTYKIVTGQAGSVKKKICPEIDWKQK